MDYWLVVKVNNVTYQNATVTVNSDTLVFDGSNAYVAGAGTGPYVAGIDYTTTIETEFGTYTAVVTGPGGNVTVTNDTIDYTYDGNADFFYVFKIGGSTTYTSTSDTPDIDPGHLISGTAFTGTGTYNVNIYPMSTFTSKFTGPTVPSTGNLMIETLSTVQVIKP